jgi:hypothetical protein
MLQISLFYSGKLEWSFIPDLDRFGVLLRNEIIHILQCPLGLVRLLLNRKCCIGTEECFKANFHDSDILYITCTLDSFLPPCLTSRWTIDSLWHKRGGV